jgi:hypothetical protein
MKLKKGSLEAKRFMAKIRAKKGKSKKAIGGWSKGNTRMIEVGEREFKTKKNVRVKRRKLGTFKKFTALSGVKELNNAVMEYDTIKKEIESYKKTIANKKNSIEERKFARIMLGKHNKLLLLVKKHIKQVKYYI